MLSLWVRAAQGECGGVSSALKAKENRLPAAYIAAVSLTGDLSSTSP